MKAVFNENAPRGHYSPGMICGNILYVSGQTSADPATGFPAEGGFEAEMKMRLTKWRVYFFPPVVSAAAL